MKINNTRPFEYWLKITESLSKDKLKEHVLAFFVKYGSKYYDNDASILEYLQNNDENNSNEEGVKTLKDALKKAMMANESFHGSPDRPEILKDDHNEIANYTGIEVKKNAKNNWAVFPKEGDNIFACDDRHGFSSNKLEYMQIDYVDHAHKIISCNQDGMEVSVKFIFSDAGHRKDNDDKIAYFRIDK